MTDIICPQCDLGNCKIIDNEDNRKIEYFSSEKKQPDKIIDCPGQLFFWNDLEPQGVRIY